MLAQFDLFSFLRFTFSSIFANIVVIAILVGMVVMAFGTVYMIIKRDVGAKVLVYGGVLVGIFVSLAAQQFGAIPVTFDGVAKLGLATFPAGPIMDAYQTTTTFLVDKIGWLSTLMMGIGGIVFLVSRGSNTGAVTWILLGAVMAGIGSLIGTGGIIT
nr:hypothetical protein [Candidatus Sigynarchaeota archaeon]